MIYFLLLCACGSIDSADSADAGLPFVNASEYDSGKRRVAEAVDNFRRRQEKAEWRSNRKQIDAC